MVPAYPPADRLAIVEDLHGHRVPDPYRWLEDPAGAATATWTAAQDALWRAYLATLPDRDRFHARVTALGSSDATGPPLWRGDRRFVLRRAGGAEHAVLVVVAADGAERVLLDPMAVDPTGATTLDHWMPDLDGRLLACQLSRRGDERAELVVLDTAAPDVVVDGPIDGCRYSPVAWLPGSEAFFYVRARAGAPRQVYLHHVGTPAAVDASILGEGRDPTTSYGLQLSPDGRWLVVSAAPGTAPSNDLWLADLATSTPSRPDLRPVQEGVAARTVAAVGRDGLLYVVTDLDAPRGRLCVTDPTTPGPQAWRDLVRAGPDEVFTGFAILDGAELPHPLLLVSTMRRGISAVGVHDLATGRRLGDVPLPGLGSVGALAVRPDGGSEAWFGYTDAVTPGSVHRYDARTGETTPWLDPGVPPRPDVATREIVYPSGDSTPVRMVVLARPDPDAGPRPAILYGYGGFGIPLTPTYSDFALAWVEAGGVFATASVRGGGDDGGDWHRAGMRDRKQNAIDDYLAAARHLIDDGWTSPAQLGACGESGGGLLVGAALTQRPDLFAAAVCSAPLLDMVRYERSGMGTTWTGEYGTADDPQQLGWLLGYSPYHHVHAGVAYPATLLTVFDGDTRVDPWHARKMCAALQWATAAPDRPILLRRESGVGHGAGAASRGVGLAADLLAFLAAHTGLTVPCAAPARG